ncbi:MAG TPA: hypothetical protein IAB92_00005 [Candidatus Faecousia faecigallinarum]|nr:hypothetical protein [Candidatus Faecousia faecigallinarum]
MENVDNFRKNPGKMRYRKLKKGEYAGNFGYFVAGEKVIHRRGFLPPGSVADFGATRCGNPFPRRKAWQVGTTSGKFAAPFVFAQSTTLRYALPQGERIATSLRSSQ